MRVAAVLLAATAVALASHAAPVRSLEHFTYDTRMQLRDARPTDRVAVIAIDDRTLGAPGRQWPLRRALHARAIDRLHAAGVARIVYDVQFTEPSPYPRDDLALLRAVRRAPGTVLATGESDGRGHTRVLGGDRGLARIGAVAAAANLPAQAGGVIRRYDARVEGLDSIATVVAGRADGGLIDYRGPAGTVPTHSFADLLAGRIPASALRGRIVVVGATAPTLQDLHPTPAGDGLMPGPEIQANAILTALRGDPLRGVPIGLLVLGLFTLGALGVTSARRAALVVVAVVVYAVLAQFAFEAGFALPVAVPVLGALATTAAAVLATVVRESRARRAADRRGDSLEAAVRARTAELERTKLEVVQRLAHAAELRDDDTGDHIERMSRLCGRVARELGVPPERAALIEQAAVLHDVGKIGLPDGILRKPGRLTPDEVATMRRHAEMGAELLDGSRSELLRLAEVIARTHHERWDGTGYPARLAREQIPLAGRIAAVCDVYDALVSTRPYKHAWTIEEALTEIREQRGRHFDPAAADALIAVITREHPGWRTDVTQATPAASDSGVPSTADSARSTEAATQVNVGVSRLV